MRVWTAAVFEAVLAAALVLSEVWALRHMPGLSRPARLAVVLAVLGTGVAALVVAAVQAVRLIRARRAADPFGLPPRPWRHVAVGVPALLVAAGVAGFFGHAQAVAEARRHQMAARPVPTTAAQARALAREDLQLQAKGSPDDKPAPATAPLPKWLQGNPKAYYASAVAEVPVLVTINGHGAVAMGETVVLFNPNPYPVQTDGLAWPTPERCSGVWPRLGNHGDVAYTGPGGYPISVTIPPRQRVRVDFSYDAYCTSRPVSLPTVTDSFPVPVGLFDVRMMPKQTDPKNYNGEAYITIETADLRFVGNGREIGVMDWEPDSSNWVGHQIPAGGRVSYTITVVWTDKGRQLQQLMQTPLFPPCTATRTTLCGG